MGALRRFEHLRQEDADEWCVVTMALLQKEDAFAVSTEWHPCLLALSVHALHGSKSADTAVLVQVREAFR